MASIALRCNTVDTHGQMPPNGFAYLIFANPTTTPREILIEKLLAEFRKARAFNVQSSSLEMLLGHRVYSFEVHPTYEEYAVKQLIDRYLSGDVVLLVDTYPVRELNEVILLTRRTGLNVLVANKTLQEAVQ